MENSQPEHFISLPLVSKGEESPRLPLAINVVARYWGEDIVPEQGAGVLIDGIELAERHGLACYIFKGSLKDVKKRIDQGIPPIVIVPGIRDTVQHATVVSGYDQEERRVLTYVPEPDTIGAVPELKFEHDWQQDDMTEIVIIPADMKDLMKNEELKFAKSYRACFEAERLRQQGKIEKAIEMLRQATESDPDSAQVWAQLAGIYNEQGSQQAVPCYERATSLNPRCYLAFRGVGNYYLKAKDYSLAEAYYTKAIEINPARYGPIYKNRAVARMQNGNNAGAKLDLEEYLKQTPAASDAAGIRDAISQL
ncbi:tetratricopeptide repeat protein [Candidatus Nitrososphaera sp. FF02]|uniref:tetratricopeptide repeat protein n=1 Tax=Candidatus Nitrososphaera sp. FF02 TaxID=3398226 RepID=UPI0039E8EB4D